MSVQISFLANMTNFIRDVRKGRVELEDVSSSLDDVRRDGSQAAGTLERSFDEIANSARKINPRESIGRPMATATHEASEGTRTLRENAASNFKEMAASTTGSVQDISSGLQGLLAEMTEGFGPGGLIAGLAAATALGMITQQIQAQDEAAQAERQTVGDLTQQLIEAGDTGQRNLSGVADSLKSITTQSDKSKINLHDISQLAHEINVPFAELAQHVAAGGDATQYAIDKTNQLIDAARQAALERQTEAGQTVTLININDGRVRALEAQRDKLVHVRDEMRRAQQAEREWLAAGGDQLQRKADATQAYADSIQGALSDAGTSWDDFSDKEGGLSLSKYERLMGAKAEAIAHYQANVAIASGQLSQDALSYIESLGIDAAPLLAKFVRAPLAQQDRIAAIWDELGRHGGQAFNGALQDQVNGYRIDPIEVTVVPVMHKSKLQHMLDALKQPQYVDVVPRAIAKPQFGNSVP